MVAPNLVYTETGTQRRVESLEDYLHLLQGWKQALPDARGTILKAVSQGNTAVQEVIWEGTQTGPLPTPAGTLPPSGKAIRVPAAIWYTVEGELVQEVHHYLDVLALLQQLGALPG
ncbi:MAG: ester cyclase [Caldilineaceae bacterium]